jgi:hypothetical protein
MNSILNLKHLLGGVGPISISHRLPVYIGGHTQRTRPPITVQIPKLQ